MLTMSVNNLSYLASFGQIKDPSFSVSMRSRVSHFGFFSPVYRYQKSLCRDQKKLTQLLSVDVDKGGNTGLVASLDALKPDIVFKTTVIKEGLCLCTK